MPYQLIKHLLLSSSKRLCNCFHAGIYALPSSCIYLVGILLHHLSLIVSGTWIFQCLWIPGHCVWGWQTVPMTTNFSNCHQKQVTRGFPFWFFCYHCLRNAVVRILCFSLIRVLFGILRVWFGSYICIYIEWLLLQTLPQFPLLP